MVAIILIAPIGAMSIALDNTKYSCFAIIDFHINKSKAVYTLLSIKGSMLDFIIEMRRMDPITSIKRHFMTKDWKMFLCLT